MHANTTVYGTELTELGVGLGSIRELHDDAISILGRFRLRHSEKLE